MLRTFGSLLTVLIWFLDESKSWREKTGIGGEEVLPKVESSLRFKDDLKTVLLKISIGVP